MTVAALCIAAAPFQNPSEAPRPQWSESDIGNLKQWVAAAPADALPVLTTAELDAAIASADHDAADIQADAIALRLAQMHLLGCATKAERAGWNINDTDSQLKLEPMLRAALADGTLNTFFALMRPSHADYAALKAAYGTETDDSRRETLARNMERWRWMPRALGPDYVMVNAAFFEAHLWRGGVRKGTWRVIVGKTRTPTPVFDTTITGVTLNPWWEIPASIVRESVGALFRNNPALARKRGYVRSGGRYRQKPGPGNALGLMKLAMPNRFSVFMHDTPNKALFDEDVRAFSHGCVRTDNALDYAAALLEGAATRKEVDAIVATGKTRTVNLAQPVPVYISYFTAAPDAAGKVNIQPDIYDRDDRILPPQAPGKACKD